VKNATAEIVAEGFALNTYQEGVPVPPPDCGRYRSGSATAFQKLGDAGAAERHALHELVEYEHAGLLLLFLGESGARLHDRAVEEFHAAQKNLAVARAAAEKASKALEDCENPKLKRPATATRPKECSADEWKPLLERGRKLKLRKLLPLARKSVAARKKHRTRQAASDQARLHGLLKAETKRLTAFSKVVTNCK